MGISVTPLPVAFGAWNCSHDGPRCQKIWIWLIRSDNGGGQLGVAWCPWRDKSSRDRLWQLWHRLCSLCGLFTTCSHSIFWWYSLCNSVCNFSEPVPAHVSWCMDNCNLYNCFCRVAIGALMAESRSAFEIFLTAFNVENEWYYHYVLRCSEHPESSQTMG